MFLHSVYFPANAFCDTTYVTHTKTPTCFGIQVPSTKGVCANLLRYGLFIVISLIKTLVVKIHKMCKIYIVNNLQCSDDNYKLPQ